MKGISAIGCVAVSVLAALVFCCPAKAQRQIDPADGNQLYEQCASIDDATFLTGVCYGTIIGVEHGWEMAENIDKSPHIFCVRSNVTHRQVIDVVMAYLREHPEERDQDVAELIALSLAKAFPCGKAP